MAKIGLQKGSGKRLKVREKSVKSQGILKWILSGNPAYSSAKKCMSPNLLGAMPSILDARKLCSRARLSHQMSQCSEKSPTVEGWNQILAAGSQGTVITCHCESQLLPQGSRSVLYTYPY